MQYYKVIKLIEEDEKTLKILKAYIESNLENPYIVDRVLFMLGDTSPYCNFISEKNKIALCKMLEKFYNTWYKKFLNPSFNIEKYARASVLEIYTVDAPNGVRNATVNEIKNGIKQLMLDKYYPVGKEVHLILCLVTWMFKGYPYFYREAGYNVEYADGKVVTPVYKQIVDCSNLINEAFDWYTSEKFEKTFAILDKLLKKNKYKYVEYEKDEITEDLSVNQIKKDIIKVFPRRSSNKDYRKALALAINALYDNKKLEPIEISFMRIQYEKYSKDVEEQNRVNEEKSAKVEKYKETIDKIKELKNERYKGTIDSNNFVFKIINTLEKNSYSYISKKQTEVIDREYENLIKKTVEDKKEQENSEKETNEQNNIEDEIKFGKDDLYSFESISDILDD